MREILFCRGCYGLYFGASLYYYTNLNPNPANFESFKFQNGSSHAFRDVNGTPDGNQTRSINLTHYAEELETKNPIVIQPCRNNHLDYFINVLAKQHHYDLNSHLDQCFTLESLVKKYKDNYDVTSDTIPNWVLREILSYSIDDVLSDSYRADDYIVTNLDALVINANDIVNDYLNVFNQAVSHWGLLRLTDEDTILRKHDEFLEKQLHHNVQYKIAEFCDAIISNADLTYKFQTIYEEAYLQYLLRVNGYELKCNGLNELPSTAKEFEDLVFT